MTSNARPVRVRHILALLLPLAAMTITGCPKKKTPTTDAGRGDSSIPVGDARMADGNREMPDGHLPTEPELRIGTGCFGDYFPVTDGDTLPMERGPQGGQHVWISLRARNLDTGRALVQLRGRNADDTEDLANPVDLWLTFGEEAPDGFAQLSGLRLVITDGDATDGQTLLIRVTVNEREPGGATVRAERRVTVRWAIESPCTLTDGTDAGMGADAGTAPDAG